MAVDSLGQLTVDLVANTGGFEKGMDRAQRSLKSATREAEFQSRQLDKLVGQIDPVVAAYGRLDKMEADLRKHRAAGRLDDVDFKDYLAKLTEQRNAIGGADAAMTKGAMSAKAYSAALRNVPAQFTDIAVSLQAGQSPLTVFLQQGGQLKDMFGGIGPAAKALSGYVLGLLNPFTLAGAAAGTLALAYYQGSQEADAFRVALVSTGNAAGTSTNQLAGMADRIASTAGTTSKASAVLAQLAGTGSIVSDSFEKVATAAINWEKATGTATEQTVAEFAKLAKDPVKTLGELDDKYNFLTASVYEQVRALQANGEKQAAAAIAEDAYAKALEQRASKIKANLGDIESAWNTLASAAKKGWDQIVGVGREQSLDEQITNTEKLINDRKTSLAAKLFPGALGEESDSTRFLKDRLKLLVQQRTALADSTKAEGENARAQREGRQAFDEYQKSREANFTKTQKMNKALEDERRRIATARAGGYTISAADEEASYKAIRENSVYKEAAGPKKKAYTEDAGTKALDAARRQYAVLQQQAQLIGDQADGTTRLGTEARKLIAWEQELADIKSKKTLTADQKSLLASADLYTAQLKRNAALEAETTLKERSLDSARKLAAFEQNLQSQLASAQTGLDNNLAGAGLGDREKQRLQEQIGIRQSYQSQMDKLARDYNKSTKDQLVTDTYNKETAALQGALDKRLAMQTDFYAKEDAARGDWLSGATSAYQNYLDSASDAAGQSKSLFTNAFTSMEDAAANFALTGKASFADFTKSVLADMARIAARQATSGLLNLGVSAISSYFSGGTTAGATQADYTGNDFSTWVSGQRAVGGLVSPNSLYQVNERGPELLNQDGKSYLMMGASGGSITPLGSGGGGLGGASSAGTQVLIQQSISVPAQDGGTSSSQDMKAVGQAYADTAKRGAQDAIAKELLPGGSIWRAVNGR